MDAGSGCSISCVKRKKFFGEDCNLRMRMKLPYFMENEEWYYYDIKNGRLILKPDAPQEAKESYEEFYSNENPGENGELIEY